MLRLTLSARLIPDGTQVTKRTGNKVYTLRKKGVTVYGDSEGNPRQQVFLADQYVLHSEEYLNIIPPDTELSVDFHGPDDLRDFIDEAFSEEG